MARRKVARRTIPVAVPAPVQLPLSLLWADPIDRHADGPEQPGPEAMRAPVVALRRAA